MGRMEPSLPMYLASAWCCSGLSAAFLHNLCSSLGACTGAFADGEVALVSLQVFSELGSSKREGKTTLSLDHRK